VNQALVNAFSRPEELGFILFSSCIHTIRPPLVMTNRPSTEFLESGFPRASWLRGK
jgi:hypothetical protein